MGPARQADVMMFLTRHVAAAIAALAACLRPAGGRARRRAAPAARARVTCTNPASGATWQISIDYDRATVDANPARVSDAEISWHDAKDGWQLHARPSLRRLTVVVASSTGGYFLHDHCRLPP